MAGGGGVSSGPAPAPGTSPPPPAPAALARLAAGTVPLEPLVPEASPRRYFRPRDPGLRGWLVVQGETTPPRATAAWLSARGVPVPALGPSLPDGYLVEDLGDRHLARGAPPAAWEALLAAGQRIWSGVLPPGHPATRQSLDTALFQRELALFREAWPPDPEAGPPDPGLRTTLAAECQRICREAAAGPRAPQHRDFHSRNVLLPPGGGVVLLDHQDLRPGPLFYDLASLATDAYTELPAPVRRRLVATATAVGAAAGLTAEASRQVLERVALQRVLKALGTFGRLLRAGREDYREPARRALGHARALLAGRPELPALREWLG